MSAISRASAYLDQKLDELRATHGVPALSAVLVRDGGDAVVACARGLRKSDAGPLTPLNQTQLTDRFNIGSISKPVTGYLIAYLVQTRPDFNWSTKIADVFTELRSLVFRRRYGIREDYPDVTVAQLMSHNAGFPRSPQNGYEKRLNTEGTERPLAFVLEYSNEASEVLRRYNGLVTYMQEKPELEPGTGERYSGGALICASMAERLTGQTYKQLLKTLVFDKLGMAHSGVGTLSTTATPPDNTWQHSYDAAAETITPNQVASKGAWGYHSYGPTGKVYMSAEDMGRFITANLHRSGKPKAVVSDATLRHAQEQPAPGETPFTRGGWKASTEDGEYVLRHNGNNHKSYAELTISPERNYGYAAMCNVNGRIGKDAVRELNDILEDMHANWTTAFAMAPVPGVGGRAQPGPLSPGKRRRPLGDDLVDEVVDVGAHHFEGDL